VKSPLGVKIYEEEDLSIFKVDGEKEQKYSTNLCMISRLFLQSKVIREIDKNV